MWRSPRVPLTALAVLVGLALTGGLAAAVRRVLRLHALARPLPEEEREREVLARSARTLREVLETSVDGVAAVDTRGRLVEWNTSAAAMLGWTREEVLGRPALEVLVPPEERQERSAQLAQLLASGQPRSPLHRLEARALRRSGEALPVEVSLSLVGEPDARLLYVFFSDVSERRRTERERQHLLEQQRGLLAELQQRSAELQGTIDNMLEPVLVVDAEDRFTYLNEAALRLLGRTSYASLRLNRRTLAPYGLRTLQGAPVPLEAMPLSRALRGEVVVNEDLRLVSAESQREVALRANAAPIRDGEGRVVAAVCVAHDITAAVEFDRMRDEFVRVAAHELKTPVAVMKSSAQLALRSPLGSDPRQRRLLESIDRGADRLDRIVRALLDVSRLRLGRLHLDEEELDLREVLERAVQRARAERPGRQVVVHADTEAPVRGDRARLEEVLAALLDNALRYSPEQTPVEVSLGRGNGEARVRIQDRGIGLSPDQQARLFERFSRPHSGTTHDRGGMGLGLYIARELVARHGGHLALESHSGEGTTVCLTLPLRDAPAEVGPEAPSSTPGGAPG